MAGALQPPWVQVSWQQCGVQGRLQTEMVEEEDCAQPIVTDTLAGPWLLPLHSLIWTCPSGSRALTVTTGSNLDGLGGLSACPMGAEETGDLPCRARLYQSSGTCHSSRLALILSVRLDQAEGAVRM